MRYDEINKIVWIDQIDKIAKTDKIDIDQIGQKVQIVRYDR